MTSDLKRNFRRVRTFLRWSDDVVPEPVCVKRSLWEDVLSPFVEMHFIEWQNECIILENCSLLTYILPKCTQCLCQWTSAKWLKWLFCFYPSLCFLSQHRANLSWAVAHFVQNVTMQWLQYYQFLIICSSLLKPPGVSTSQTVSVLNMHQWLLDGSVYRFGYSMLAARFGDSWQSLDVCVLMSEHPDPSVLSVMMMMILHLFTLRFCYLHCISHDDRDGVLTQPLWSTSSRLPCSVMRIRSWHKILPVLKGLNPWFHVLQSPSVAFLLDSLPH